MTEDPIYNAYIHGRLRLAGVDLNTPLAEWLDAAYAIYIDAPHKVLEAAAKEMIIGAAKLRPDRETWGALPEHRRLAGGMRDG